MGEAGAEVWCNQGLACFYAGQYDICFGCFERAIGLADDALLPDIWYNVGQVACALGQLPWAEQCFRLAVALDPGHAEALNNLGVLESRKGGLQQAAARFRAAARGGCGGGGGCCIYEAHFNAALLAHGRGDLQEALSGVTQALSLFPEHADSLELRKQLRRQLNAL